MRRYTSNGLVFYRFENLEALGLNHAIFTRHGGHSEGKFRSLNVSFSVGDERERVEANRLLVGEALGVEGLASARQVHGKTYALISGPQAPAAEIERGEADILLTERPGLGLMIKQADCQAVLLYEPQRHVLAAVHCGWRGSVAGVLGEAVARLEATFGGRPGEMRAAVAPSLGPCCAEFRDWRRVLPEAFARFQVAGDHFDFWQLSTQQLVAAGLSLENIEVSGRCTRCSSDFYSYRREGVTGRFATVGAL